MKKKLLILAAVAVSGLAAVVASNNNKVLGNNEANSFPIEFFGSSRAYCLENGDRCEINAGLGWVIIVPGYQFSNVNF